MTTSLTKGNETKALLVFSMPMILGNLLQQLYNVADTLIVGKYLGPKALAAVGSSYALMVLLTSVVLGLCMGSGIVFAQLFGAKQDDRLKTALPNAFGLIAVITLLLTLLSYTLLEQFIRWLRIPAEAAPLAAEYLYIIFGGMGFVFLYNFFASVLRSTGNTMVPLLFLGIAAVINIVLDITFILFLNWGIAGAAIATVIAQAFSAVAIAVYFLLKTPELCPRRQHFRLDRRLLSLICSNSLLTSIQQSIMNFGILMIQGLVNSFGLAATAAFAAVVKIDAFAYMPAQDFGNAFATFVAQNAGAGQHQRIQKGTRSAVMISCVFCLLSSAAVNLFARPLMLLFLAPEQSEIIAIGIQYLRIEGSCYVGIGILFLLYAFYRGLGRSQMSIVLTILSLGSRVLLAYLLAPIPQVGLVGIWWAIPIGWALADAFGLWYLFRYRHTLLTIRL